MGVITKLAGIEPRDEFDGKIRVIGSTEAEDRSGDIIKQDGWKLDSFRANPIVHFNHRRDAIIGTAAVKRGSKGLEFDISLAEEGTGAVVDYVRSLVRQKILKAASVGFMPIKYALREKRGIEWIEQELLEISLVGVPDNPEAVAIAKDFGLGGEICKVANAVDDFEQGLRAAQTRHANRLREIEMLRLKCPRMGANS